VLVVQFISLQNVSWPARNTTLTPAVARRILSVHKELAALIEMRDAAGARRLMDDHVKMIRARRTQVGPARLAHDNAQPGQARVATRTGRTGPVASTAIIAHLWIMPHLYMIFVTLSSEKEGLRQKIGRENLEQRQARPASLVGENAHRRPSMRDSLA